MMRSCRMYVCFDEIESGNAVVFRKNEIVATGMHDRLVQHVTFLATVSFMPEVDDVHVGNLPVILDHFTGPVIGTIVGDDELETLVVLVFVAPKDFLQPFMRVMGTDDVEVGKDMVSSGVFARRRSAHIPVRLSPILTDKMSVCRKFMILFCFL